MPEERKCGGGLVCGDYCQRAKTLEEVGSDSEFLDLVSVQIEMLRERISRGHCQRPDELQKVIDEVEKRIIELKSKDN